jgi:hypothetical protein
LQSWKPMAMPEPAATIEDHVRRLVDAAPTLSSDQRARIAQMLGGGGRCDSHLVPPAARRARVDA